LFENKLLTDFKNAIKADSHTETSYQAFKQGVKTNPNYQLTDNMKSDITNALGNTDGELYKFFNTHDYNTLYSPVENSLPNLIQQSKEGKAYYQEVFKEAMKQKINTGDTEAAPPAALQRQFGSTTEAPQLPKLIGDDFELRVQQKAPVGVFGPNMRSSVNNTLPDMSAYTTHRGFETTTGPGVIPDKIVPVIHMGTNKAGGGSKRRPKSSRRHRRVKFGKSKKGRTTRRIVRKHRK
jgi:hypothetical protein